MFPLILSFYLFLKILKWNSKILKNFVVLKLNSLILLIFCKSHMAFKKKRLLFRDSLLGIYVFYDFQGSLMKLFEFQDFHDSLMEFMNFISFLILVWNSKILHDFNYYLVVLKFSWFSIFSFRILRFSWFLLFSFGIICFSWFLWFSNGILWFHDCHSSHIEF